MKILIAQQKYICGDFEGNTTRIIEAIKKAQKQQSDLLVFSELCITGARPADFLLYSQFLEETEKALERIREASQNIAVIVGAPFKEGKSLYNAAYVISNQKLIKIFKQTNFTYPDELYKPTYFAKDTEPKSCFELMGKKISVSIGSELSQISGDNPLDIEHYFAEAPDLLININSLPFHNNHQAGVNELFKGRLPVVHCNAVGADAGLIYGGASRAWNGKGELILELPEFEEVITEVDWNATVVEKASAAHNKYQPDLGMASIYKALILGIRDYFSKSGFRQALVTSSGGIDSAVVLTLACHALGSENVRALSLPSKFSSEHSVKDARQLSENLGNPYNIISIETANDAVLGSLNPLFKDLPFNVAEENIQARLRALIAMAVCNKFGLVLFNCSNKSELSVGYGTLYGDLSGGLSVIGDLFKTQVYALARYINRNGEVIPKSILTKAPSAELRPGQKDSDSLPDYKILDEILFRFLENREEFNELIKEGFGKNIIERVLTLVAGNEYKRKQFCPILSISQSTFGVHFDIPAVSKDFLRRN